MVSLGVDWPIGSYHVATCFDSPTPNLLQNRECSTAGQSEDHIALACDTMWAHSGLSLIFILYAVNSDLWFRRLLLVLIRQIGI